MPEENKPKETEKKEPEDLTAYQTLKAKYEKEIAELKESKRKELEEKDKIIKEMITGENPQPTAPTKTRVQEVLEYVKKLRG